MSYLKKFLEKENNKPMLSVDKLRGLSQNSATEILNIAKAEIANPDSAFYGKKELVQEGGRVRSLGPSVVIPTQISADLVFQLVMDEKISLKDKNFAEDIANAKKAGNAEKDVFESPAYERLVRQAGLASRNPGVV